METPQSLADMAATTSHALSVESPGSLNFKKAERLNSKLLKICERAIEQCEEAPPTIRDWRDLKTAREIMAAASGTDVQKPTLNLIFPPSLEGQSSEPPRYLRIPDISPSKPVGRAEVDHAPALDPLPPITLHAVAAHAAALEGATGRGAGGRSGA